MNYLMIRNIFFSRDYNKLFVFLAKSGYLEDMQNIFYLAQEQTLLFNPHFKLNYLNMSFNDAFYESCANDNLEIAEWLWSIKINHNNGITDKYNLSNALRIACFNNCLNTIKFILSNNLNNVSPNNFNDGLQMALCKKKLFDVSELIYENMIETNTTIDYDKLFTEAVKSGNIDTIEWVLKKISIDTIIKNKKCDFDSLFIYACNKDNLNIAQWIYGLNINIKPITYGTAIRHAAKTDNLDIIKWLKLIKN